MQRTVAGMGYDLVELERSAGGLLRVTIDRVPGHRYPTGEAESVTVDDCEAVTRQLQYVLEVEACDYARLEVSSPGLDRPLRGAADYARFAGAQVEIVLKQPLQGRKRFKGQLLAGEGTGWRLLLAPPEPAKGKSRQKPAADAGVGGEQALDFALDEVREARLVPVLDFKGRRAAAPQPDDKEAEE